MSRLLRAWAPVVAVCAVLFWLSSQSQLPSPHIPNIDKVEHATAYGILAWLAMRAFGASSLDAAWGVVLASLYGVSDEIHQAFVPGRSSDVFDWMADTAGALVALYLFRRWRAHRAAGKSNTPAPLGAPETAQ